MAANTNMQFNPFRVIPCLLFDGSGMVKTERFRKPRYLGDILNALRIFNEKEVDEIAMFDIAAARSRTSPDLQLVAELAAECFMPLAYGGGISSAAEASRIIRLGVEKVVLNTAALTRPGLIGEIAASVGSQSVVVGIDVKKGIFGGSKLTTHGGTRTAPFTLEAALEAAEREGAGEILLQSVDRDGTQSGYDLDLVRAATRATRLPLIASGGAATASDLAAAITTGGASAVAGGAMFVYQGPHRAVLISYPTPAEIHEALQAAGK